MATIQWYPGHMNKARNQLEDKLGLIDVLVEVLDARIPQASRNPMILKENDNIFASYFLGVKYVVSTEKLAGDYKKIKEVYDKKTDRTYYLYENNQVLPVFYGRTKTISEKAYQELSYPENVLALLQYTITEDSKEIEFFNDMM